MNSRLIIETSIKFLKYSLMFKSALKISNGDSNIFESLLGAGYCLYMCFDMYYFM